MPLTDVRIRSLKPADKPHKYSDGGVFFFSFLPAAASSGAWPTALRAKAGSSVSGPILPYLSRMPESAAMKPDAFWRRVLILPHTSDSSRKPEKLPNGTVFRILPANGTPHAWRHSLQSIRERSCSVSATTFSRLLARHPSPGWKCRISWPCSGRWR